jgi:hypothetical protein
MTENSYRLYKAILLLIFTTFTMVCTVVVGQHLEPIVLRVDKASAQLLECKSNPACLQSQILATTGSVKAIAGAIAKSAPQVASTLTQASATSQRASNETVALLQQVQGTVDRVNTAIVETQADTHTVLETANRTVENVNTPLAELATLEVSLDRQVNAVGNSAVAASDHIQMVLADPSITNAFANLDLTSKNMADGTKSAANTLETVDIATRDLRQKAGRVKYIIGLILHMITVPISVIPGL